MSINVIGAGYGRTGTKSLKLALEELGYGTCYHMEEFLSHPEGVIHWKNAMNNTKVDWDALFSGYQSIVDFPGCLYYKELAEHYPDSKVILSMRDAESWYDSVSSTIFSFDPGVALKLKMVCLMPFSATARNLFKAIMLNNESTWEKHFEGRFEDKDYAIQQYHTHIEKVKSSIPPDRLLLHHAKDGWEPICIFLGKDVPSSPYPNANKKEDFHVHARNIVRDVLQ